MFGNEALSIVIGLTFIYLLYSLLGSLVQEIVSTNIQLRGFLMRCAIRTMLGTKGPTDKPSFSDAFLNHPNIKFLKKGNGISDCPSYIDQDIFSKVIIDLLRGNNITPGSSAKVPIQNSLAKKALAWDTTQKTSINDDTAAYLNSIWIDSQSDVQRFKASIEVWYLDMMNKATEWYKQWTQLMLMLIGLGVAIAFNVDTLKIVKKLENSPALTAQVIAQANDFVKAHPNLDAQLQQSKDVVAKIPKGDTSKKKFEATVTQYSQEKHLKDSLVNQANTLVKKDITKVNDLLGLGWPKGFLVFEKGEKILSCVAGWLLTALAISLGAPFWFDLLNKLMQLRGAVSPDDDKNAGTDNKVIGNSVQRVG